MAIRQYIGARYVVKIYENSVNPLSADWENGVAYEPLTMVNYNNSSYISRKQVPPSVGNPVANPSYWALSGLYNGQIAQLQSDVADLQDDVEKIKAGVKLAIITDSYGGTFSNTIRPFTLKITDYSNFVEGTNYCYAHYDGAGFVSDGRYYDVALQNLYSNMPGDMLPEDITDLVIVGGCNDALIGSGIPAGMLRTINLAKTYFPNAKIHIGIIGGFNTLAGRINIAENVMPTYLNCESMGAAPLQNLQYIMTKNSYFQGDGIHPSQTGMNAIASGLLAALHNGFSEMTKTSVPTITKDPAFNSFTFPLRVKQINSDIQISIGGSAQANYASATTMPQGNVTIGTYTDELLKGNINNIFNIGVTFIGTDGGSVVLPITFNNGQIILINDKARNITGVYFNRFLIQSNILYN